MAGKWERDFYQPGHGDAKVFYAVYGDFHADFELDSSRYRSSGPPTGTELTLYNRKDHASFLEALYGGYLGAILAEDPELERAVAAAPTAAVLHGIVPDPATLDYLRDSFGLIAALLDAGGVAVLDSLGLKWFSKSEWMEDVFTPNAPQPIEHVAMLASPEPEGLWLHTRGMRKFGRPDLSVRGLSQDELETYATMLETLIESLARGAIIPDDQRLRLEGTKIELSARLEGGNDDPDFNNPHYELAP